MFYNRDNPQWQFSEEQYLGRDEYYRIVGEYDELCKNMLRADIRDINSSFYGIKDTGTPEQHEANRKKMIIGIVGGIIVFAALILALLFKQIVIFGYGFSAIFLIAGISMVVSGKGEIVESTSKALMNRFIGAGIALGSAAIIVLIIFRNRLEGAEFFLMLAVLVFGLAGLVMLGVSILKALSGKIIYTEEINATCTGYVRYVDRDSGDNGARFTFIHASPLFSYSYDGVQYEAVWDEFVVKQDLDIAMGQSVPIKVDPKHPENIMSPSMTHPGGMVFMIFMSVVFIAVGVGMGIYIASGAAKGMTVETQWNPIVEEINGENSRTKITDDMIKSFYLDKQNITGEWYCETAVVATKEYTANGQSITYTDPTFNGAIYPDGEAPEPGTVLILFYTVDEDFVQYGTKYKRVFGTADPESFEYAGSHGAYVPE